MEQGKNGQWSFGTLSTGEDVQAFTLVNDSGASAVVMEYGASLQSLCVPDRSGVMTDVVLGYDSAEQYETQKGNLGSIVGRFANRIGGARFSLNGREYPLAANNGPNSLHGGISGFSRRIWKGERLSPSCVRFTRFSADMEEGFPGNLQVNVTYTLDNENSLHIEYDAICDTDTPLNLTNHAYFDLSGCGKAMEQLLRIDADEYLEIDENTLPTGRRLAVEESPFDFRSLQMVGSRLFQDDPQLHLAGGYDHNYCLKGKHAATMRSDESGIEMDTYTDLPGLQFYTSNFLSERPGKNGQTMQRYSAVCLEAQNYPNAVNCPEFPTSILPANTESHWETIYAFHIVP